MLAVTMIAGLITGCGGNSSDKGRAGEDGKVKLTLWHMEETDARVQAFQEVIDKFNESQSEVEVSVAVQSWDDAYICNTGRKWSGYFAGNTRFLFCYL